MLKLLQFIISIPVTIIIILIAIFQSSGSEDDDK
jgi:hypothetical protein